MNNLSQPVVISTTYCSVSGALRLPGLAANRVPVTLISAASFSEIRRRFRLALFLARI
jgi:hypothetical protein